MRCAAAATTAPGSPRPGCSGWGLDSLVYAAQEQECQLALYGHTHEADSREIGGVKVVNPGTAGVGRTLTWALITVFDNGGVAVEIKEL